MGFLKFILVLVLIYYSLKFIARVFLYKVIKSNPLLKQAFEQQRQMQEEMRAQQQAQQSQSYQGSTQNGQNATYQTINFKKNTADSVPHSKRKQSTSEEDYIDFEEVK